MKCMPTPLRRSSDSECPKAGQSIHLILIPTSHSHLFVCAYLNSVSTAIYLDADQTDLRKPSRCVSLFMLSSDSPMARTKPERA